MNNFMILRGDIFFSKCMFFSCSLRSTNFQSGEEERNFFFISEIILYFFKFFEG